MDTATTDIEIIGIPEWCKRIGCSLDTGYRAARNHQIPGLFTIGKLRRINWEAFINSTHTQSPTTTDPV